MSIAADERQPPDGDAPLVAVRDAPGHARDGRQRDDGDDGGHADIMPASTATALVASGPADHED